jgi:hypothetical protein
MAAYESVCRKLEEMAARPSLLLGAGRPPDAYEDDGDLPVKTLVCVSLICLECNRSRMVIWF